MANKTIVISGASAGIGSAIALKLARSKHTLVLGARRIDKLQSIAEECKQLGASAVHVLELDVTKTNSIQAFAKKTLELTSKVDVLVNNAGLAIGTEHVKDGNPEDWQKVFDTNVIGLMMLTRAFLPDMVTRKSGQLIFLSSIAAHQVYEGGAAYAASKHAVRAIAQTLKLELNGSNIRVCTVDPGMVETEFGVVRFRGDADRAKKVYQGFTPLYGDDIAHCVNFMIDAPANLNVDEMIVTPVAQASVYKAFRT